MEFDAFGEHWRCRLDSYACERAEFTPPGNPLEVPSPDKKVAVSRRGHDLWARSLSDGREWALTTDGEPDYQYGSGPDCHKQRHPAAQVRPAVPAARGGLVARLDEGAGASDR